VLGFAAPIAAGLAEAAPYAQHPGPAQRPLPADEAQGQVPEIVVRGNRRSAITNLAPLATFDADAVAATGAASMDEFLRGIRGVTRSADGSEPIFLLNAQRVSGYQEIGTLPREAIEKVEVLPEQAALKFGYPPTRRVLKFITKRRFRQTELSAVAGTTTRSSGTTQKVQLGMTRLHDDGRRTLSLEYRRTDPPAPVAARRPA
jgi:outer membrane cobalamin receptor